MQTRLKEWFLSNWLYRNGYTSTNISSTAPARELPDLYEATVAELQDGLDSNRFSSVDLVKAYIGRIEEVNLKGPALRAVLEINPVAVEQASQLDKERRSNRKRGPLHGIPLLLKDNIDTDRTDGMSTTAGSFALQDSIPPKDAGVVTKLREAGAVILGKANLSEFGQFRSHKLTGGWSALGGQGTNAYYPNGDTCGSSSGSAVAVSIGLCALALGTDTTGSITFPASRNNIVGIKPTVGLTSRAGVVPISSHQDTVGPLTRSVTDAAILLSAIAGPDPNDNATSSQPFPLPKYIDALDPNSLAGKRIGVPRKVFIDSETHPVIIAAFEDSLEIMRTMGAIIVDPADLPSADDLIKNGWMDEELICLVDFKIDLNKYLSELKESPSGVRTLEDLIKFIEGHPDLEQPRGYEDQSVFLESNNTSGYNAELLEILERKTRLSGEQGIDAVLSKYNLDALVAPHSTFQAAVSANAGYPMIQVPLGFFPDDTLPAALDDGPTFYPAPGTPFGISFFASAWSEYQLLGMAYAFEQKTQTRLKRRAYTKAIPSTQL
ncbi:amidase signature enzyme [Lentinula aff. detonsa]|uniref:Amidase signature enzyme n=1 Tax=Lentinula aff. detonsa TaxID=2804958 RepID=A0AA38NDF7_9AGAR|nr:amidase signature enzyme [Lentinula aff. detonsa]